MAANTNKRVAIKHVRDRAKSAYEKKECCHICSSSDSLELHHTTSLTLLLDKWSRDTGNPIDTDEQVLAIRDQFIEEHRSEIYEEVFTLCLKHHQKLHSVFGKAPPLNSSTKQNRWIEIQKAKALGIVDDTKKVGSFSKFY
jgi:hypothetical protein